MNENRGIVSMIRLMKSVIVVISLLLSVTSGLDLEDYSSCCVYCHGDGELWVSISDPWNLTVEGRYVTDFRRPAKYFLEEHGQETYEIEAGRYVIEHAGAPVNILYTDVSYSTAILDSQYVQYDLIGTRDVTGVIIQGGYFVQPVDDLVDEHRSWPTSFIMSYSTGATASGPYTYIRAEDGNIEVFNGCTNGRDAMLNSLFSTLATPGVRIHPLGGNSIYGVTNQIMMRVSFVICTSGLCTTARSNCEMMDWGSWSECICTWEGCLHERERQVYRYEACGGLECPEKWQREECVAAEPLWQTLLKWFGLGLCLALILIILIVCMYKRHQKRKQALVFDKRGDERTFERKHKKKEKEGKDKSRKDSMKSQTEEIDETTEGIISPKQVKVERQDSEPDLDKMYKVERDELVAAPAAVAPTKHKKKAAISPDNGDSDAKTKTMANDGTDDDLMNQLNAIGTMDEAQKEKKKKKKKKKTTFEDEFGGDFVAGGQVDDVDDLGF